jgi:hypothetical protein
MATSNFHSVNPTGIYAFIPSYDDDQLYDDDLGYVIDDVVNELSKHRDWTELTKTDPYELRSYPSKSLGSIRQHIIHDNDTQIEIRINIVVRSGYYEGINFDYHYNIEDCYGNDVDDEEPYLRYVRNVTNWVEEVFENHTTKLNVVAKFSNGETIYSR